MSGRSPHRAVLLDTCALIWLANGDHMMRGASAAIVQAGLADGVYVSPVSAWEIGLLSLPRPRRPALQFLPDPKTWFTRFLAGPGIKQAPLTPAVAIDSAYLPGALHGDPADRLIVATARSMGVPVVTRDSRIIDYGRGGNVAVIAC
jgi:PIN domain nuclease of toxin-antitoxin system